MRRHCEGCYVSRHCERSEAIHLNQNVAGQMYGLLRYARNDGA